MATNSLNMPAPKLIVKLPIPELKKEYLEMVPEFKGEPPLLNRFIEVCEKLVNRFYDHDNLDNFQNEYLLSSILAKIKGPAAEIVSTSKNSSWNELKTALLNGYSDKRDCFTLNIEMVHLKQNGNETPFDFFNKIQKLLNLQISYMNNHLEHTEAHVMTDYVRNLAVRVLLNGLREPLGSLMRTRKPEDMNSALHMLTNDFQFLNSNQSPKLEIPQIKQKTPPYTNRPNNTQTNYFKSRPFNNSPQQRPQFNNHTKTNGNNKSNPNFNQNYTPTPMSISTNNTVPRTNYYRPNYNRPGHSNNQMYSLEDEEVLPENIDQPLTNLDLECEEEFLDDPCPDNKFSIEEDPDHFL